MADMGPGPTEPTIPPAQEREALEGQRKLLSRLQHSAAVQRGDVVEALRELTEATAQMLRVERASVWRLDPARSRIECLDLYRRSHGDHASGAVIARTDYPAYFRALAEERTIAAGAAHVDPRTCELAAGYLVPHGIGAMLDAPIFVGDQMFGVICHEHVGPPRRWHLWEELVAGTVADFVAFTMHSHRRRLVEQELVRHRDELESMVEERTRQLRASEESFRKLFEACPIPLVLSTDDRILGVNTRAASVFRVGAEEAIGMNPATFYQDAEERSGILDRIRSDGFAYDVKTRLRTHDGIDVPVLVSFQKVELEGKEAILSGIQDVTRQEETETRLRELATRDPLLDVLNRRRFFELAAREMERARRYKRPIALAMIDVDHFKGVNDRHGHAVGDRVLVAIATVCNASVRQSDILARYGGEELVVLLPETEIAEATRVIERLRAAIADATVDSTDGPLRVTVSAGVVGRVDDEDAIEAMLVRADRALYAAKAGGRNCVVTQ